MKDLHDSLQSLLSDSYILLLKTQNFHWNVKGPMFHQLHLLFEAQYNELFTSIDVIAERIRSLGHPVIAQYDEFLKVSKIKDSHEKKALKMVKELIDSNEAVVKTAKKMVKAAQKHGDDASADLGIERINVHEKSIWMLKSILAEE